MVRVIRRTGSVAELHALDPFAGGPLDEPEVWHCELADAAIVLGSRQTPDMLDPGACRAAGLDVVRRRSGGGAVLLRPDATLWIDLVMPHGTVPDDVRGSMVRIGECWLAALGVDATELAVHRGGMTCSSWSDLVCFSGVGPGEVVRADPSALKVVGLSQRRTRYGIRVQGLVYRRSVAAEYRSLFAVSVPEHEPPGQGWIAELDVETLIDQLANRITSM